MFGFIKICFFTTMMFFGCNLSSINPLKSISLNNQECKVRPKIVNFNSDEPVVLLVLKQVNAMVVVIISIMHTQNCVLLMLIKT